LPETFITTRRVEFIDTDMAGIVHYSNFARYAEAAESEFYRALDLTLVGWQPDGTKVGWPRVSCSFSFKAPACFEDVLQIRINVARIGVKSLTLHFQFLRDEKLLATGELKTAFCVFPRDGEVRSLPIPREVIDKLEPFLIAPAPQDQHS
jgi:YbgC/YbaW family acyl-CoA thioester hydrolase